MRIARDDDERTIAERRNVLEQQIDVVWVWFERNPHHLALPPALTQQRAQRRRLIGKGIKPHVLKLSNDGTPCHPLYLCKTLKPVVWKL